MLETIRPRITEGKAGADHKSIFGELFSSPSEEQYGQVDAVHHFYGIDVLRGLSAIVILIWHYQIFFFIPTTKIIHGAPELDRTIQPFYNYLKIFYEHGFWAVSCFWVISGFVFSHVYSGRSITSFEFATSRFSRLYPLHFITLIVIALLQFSSESLLGHYQVLGANTGSAFFLHLFFLSGWGFQSVESFNGPIWSVSVEIAIYALFFVLSKRIFSFGILIPLVIVFSTGFMINNQAPVNNFDLCAFFFFTGASIHFWIIKFRTNDLIFAVPGILCVAIFTYLIASGQHAQMRFYNVQFFFFLPIILLIARLDCMSYFQKIIHPIKWLGNTTYSTYLWHFPIQVGTLIIIQMFGISNEVFMDRSLLIIWVAGMIIIAHFSFLFIERPLKLRSAAIIKAAWKIAPRRTFHGTQYDDLKGAPDHAVGGGYGPFRSPVEGIDRHFALNDLRSR
jgi:peptidoglycan/LPS O-acetylase OafA/YrhL